MPRPPTILATLLAAVVVWGWVRSYRAADGLAVLLDGGRTWGIASVEGRVLMVATSVKLGPRRAWTAETIHTSLDEARLVRANLLAGPDGSPRGKFGFAAAAQSTDALGIPGAWAGTVAVPHWFLATLLLIPLGRHALRTAKVRRRQKAGRCAACGYDLRGATGKCPECGATPG